MNYRPEVDGLRAVAVIPVILFHAGFGVVSGGFVGVDIFFVISGYLITGIIYAEIRKKNFSIINFYERRARRILPALFFVSLVSLVLAWNWMLPEEFESLSESLIAVNLFVSNFYYWLDTDYFAGAAEMKPFLHTWSLAIEEQFYFIFPLVMLLLGFLTRPYLLATICLALLASLGLAQWASEIHPSTNFYLLPTRAWELLAGSVVAIAMHERRLNVSKRLHNLGSLAGLALIVYSILVFDKTTPFPSLWAVLPVLGASLIILFARTDNIAGRLLSLKPMVGIGLISYSAYLWHQPIFVFARERSFDMPSHLDFLFLSLLSLLLAYITWRFVEQPFRQKQRFTRKHIFSGALAATVLMLGFSAYGVHSEGVPTRLSEEALEIVAVRDDRDLGRRGCQAMPGHPIAMEDACEFNEEYLKKIVVWGDSQATPLVLPTAKEAETLAMSVKQLVFTNCLPVAGYTRSDSEECGKFNNEALNLITKNNDIEIVFMLGRYPLQFEAVPFDNQEGGVEMKDAVYAVPSGKLGNEIDETSPHRVTTVGGLIKKTVTTLVNSGVKVVLIYPVPETGWDVPEFLAKEALYGKKRDTPLSTSYQVFRERTRSAYQQLDQVEDHENLLKIKPESLFCNTRLPGRCVAQIDGKPLYYDNNHLSRFGATLLIEHIFQKIREAGWIQNNTIIASK
ncbi:acyltransferase family protein [Pistricoccus aurantiacus]|uniref:acyltransferase family protein n=1 Tax=Pistricoccus aurantiacus TaxID=1883414 RepID=UPI0036271230